MSLINKMLQDLDARGGGDQPALQQQELKAVPAQERDRRPMLYGGAALGVLVIAAAGWYGWQQWQVHKAPAGPVPKVVDNRIPDRPRFQEPPRPVATQADSAASKAGTGPATAAAEVAPVAAVPA
ncbi:hypothetical protein E4L98_12175, partial [Duganella callida]